MRRTTFLFFVTLIGLLVALVHFARQGDIWAASILAALWTMIAVAFGAFIAVYIVRQQGIKQQGDFALNTKENLLLMQQLQRLQNLQNKVLIDQVGKLPGPQQHQDGLVIEDGIFDELE